MNPLKLSLAALALVSLGGCAMHQRHHGGAAGMPGPGPGAHMNRGAMDMNAQCDQHRQTMRGKSPAERRAMMERDMASMTPEMRRQMQDMYQKCQ